MPPPPPPPPGPPPAPSMTGLSLTSGSSGQERNMLLDSIRHGTKLKKTVTNDKSGPYVGGKVSGSINNNVSSESSRMNGVTTTQPPPPMGLGGLFAGGMPKLKSTGLNIGSTNSSATRNENNKNNRGPPPQPPPANQKPTIPSSASDSTITSTTTLSNNGLTNRTSKPPVGGYGKPNLAPRPPPVMHQHSNSVSGSIQSLTGSEHNLNSDYSDRSSSVYSLNEQNCKPSPPPKKLNISRAQSMRSPRSPPAASPANYTINNNNNNNNHKLLVRNRSGLHQSQDSLVTKNRTGTLPNNYHGVKVAPSPPTMPPPSTPIQSQRGTPTRPPGTKPPPPPSRIGTNMPPPPAPPCTAPPPPPHRINPPKQFPAAPNAAPPAPPARVSSMRNGSLGQSDLEIRYSQLFHQVQEFPAPTFYRNVVKTYNSKNQSTAKQQAPQPPSTTQLQSNIKLWASNTSQC